MIRRREAWSGDRQPRHRTLSSHGDAAALRQGAGGGGTDSGFGYLSSAELYDPGLGFDPSWQPLLTTVSPSISAEWQRADSFRFPFQRHLRSFRRQRRAELFVQLSAGPTAEPAPTSKALFSLWMR